ncbi:hypothetical protein Mal15_22280 [Stieleria maiorica]|uniref:Uncharacterized protein n=1 Tax=Stieleria maiorica TaxID=2795974 RepID=A0A5B9MDZ6_9BACT|nr:hypothetical protein [Stieleria maiorica]QEF98180.1 hypothetical protein Mal15_22280 [Stieleria maiorica]
MQIVLTSSEIAEAPGPVRKWIADKIGLPALGTEPKTTPKANGKRKREEPADPEPEEINPPTMDELLEAASSLLEQKGTPTLKKVLAKVGIERVKECPEDKYAELLAEIAVYA